MSSQAKQQPETAYVTDAVALEVEEILAYDRLHGRAKHRLLPDYESLAQDVEARASLHLKGPLHARAVAEMLRTQGWAELVKQAISFRTSGS
jgi:hypothetical protein